MPTKDHEPKRKTAAEILAIEDTKAEELAVPEWDTVVTIKPLTKRQQIDIRKAARVGDEIDPEKVQAGMFREAVIDPHFEEEQMAALFEKNAKPVDRILKRVLEISGIEGEEDVSKREAAFPKG